MLTAAQLDVLLDLDRPITDDEALAFKAVELRSTPVTAAEDAERLGPWLASIGISGPPPRVGVLARRLAQAVRRMATRV